MAVYVFKNVTVYFGNKEVILKLSAMLFFFISYYAVAISNKLWVHLTTVPTDSTVVV